MYDWCVERVVSRTDVLVDLLKIRSLCTEIPLGSEGTVLNEIFKIVTERAPVYKILYNNIDESSFCPVCHRKSKNERPLAFLHLGARMTSAEVRTKVVEQQLLREEKIKKKEERECKKRVKLHHQGLSLSEPLSSLIDPTFLTVKQLNSVLCARNIAVKKNAKKCDLIALIVQSNNKS